MTSEAVSYDSSRAGTTTSGQLRGSGLMNKSLKDMNKSLKNVTRKQEEEHDEKPGCSLPNNTTCPLCIELHKVTKTKQKLEDWEEEIPATVLSIIGDSKKYLPCETIKNQLKRGLLELMKKTNIWIITEGRNTCVGEIVEEVIRGNTKKTKSHVLHRDITSTSKEQCRHQSGETFIQPDECSLEVCIKDHLKIPLILIVVGGDENSFKTAMTYLKMNFPVLVIDGSGSAADFICKGYRMHKNSAEKTVFLDTFQSEMTEAATTIFCSFEEKQNTNKTCCERLTMQLQEALEENWKSIYVYLVNDTTYTLDSTIQDILFKFLCKDEKNKEKLTDNILYFVDLWNRPDIAGKEIFKLGNSKVLENLKDKLGIKHSYLSKLFTNALVFNRVSLVKQVLEYLLDKEQYKQFLDHSLEDLYENTDCMAGYFISTFKKTGIIARFIPLTCLTRKKQETYKQKNIVKKINDAVIKILGSQQMKPFDEGDNKNNDAINGIRIDDIFKHLFIWAVLMNRRDLAMLFWKKENSDYICSALYASSLAKRLADMLAGDASAEEFMDELAGLLESSRYYEDLAYSVMTELYSNDRKHARQLLVTEVTRYNSTTIFTIAEKFTLMKFMGHAACQTKLTQIWKGRILGDISILYAIIVTFLPFLIMWTVRLDNTDEITVHRVIPSLMTDTKDQETQKSVKLLNWMRKIYYFYNSPLIKFFVSVVTYMAMLVVFSLFVLTDLYPMSEKFPSIKEYTVYVWTASTLAEEIRQVFEIKQVKNFWALFECLKFLSLITSVCLRLSLPAEQFFYARMAYAITLGLFIINSMKFFLVSKHIGPKVIMIGRLMIDLLFFILIFAVFVFGFGVVYQATRFPNSISGLPLFQNIVYMPYWQLYGELFLDHIHGREPDPCTKDVALYSNGTIPRCPEVNQINTFVLAVYMVLTHIILVNILIAMFSHTFAKEQHNNDLVWKFYRFSLIQEYYDKSSLLQWLFFISYVKRAVIYIFNTCKDKRNNKFKEKRSDAANEKLAILEKDAVCSYLNSSTGLRKHYAENMEAEKDGFDASYEEETDPRLQEQF